ncbi:MAG: Clp protease N-terminal domain-containing protein, partial [Candidatus Saccharimonadales bacterium]
TSQQQPEQAGLRLPVQLPVQPERRPVQKKAPEPPKPQPIITDEYKALVGLLGKKSDGDELARLADKLGARVTRHRAGKHETGIAFQGAGLWWVTDAGLISAVFIELRDPEKGFDSFRGGIGFGTTQQQCRAAMEKIEAQFIDSGKAPQHSGASKLHIWERYIHDATLLRFNFDQETGKLHNLSVLRLEPAPVRPSGRATCEQIIENHLSPAAQGLLSRAKQEARRLDHDEIGTEQLLSALLATEGGVTHDLFRRFNLTADHVRTEVDKILPRGQGKTEYWLSPRLRVVIMVAWDEACRRESSKVHTTHLLLALLRFRQGFAIRILEALGVDIDHMRNALFDSLESSQDATP